jgi:hypothetical protein
MRRIEESMLAGRGLLSGTTDGTYLGVCGGNDKEAPRRKQQNTQRRVIPDSDD